MTFDIDEIAGFTSDPHFFHKNITQFCNRPFTSVEEMNAALIAEFNAVNGPLLICGDFAFCNRTKMNDLLDQITVPLVLVRGNHDPNLTVKAFQERGFTVVDKWKGHFAGRAVQMSHYPYVGDSHDGDRFTDRRPVDRGEVLIHGHVHDKWKINGRQVNLGWDAWHKVLSPYDLAFAISGVLG